MFLDIRPATLFHQNTPTSPRSFQKWTRHVGIYLTAHQHPGAHPPTPRAHWEVHGNSSKCCFGHTQGGWMPGGPAHVLCMHTAEESVVSSSGARWWCVGSASIQATFQHPTAGQDTPHAPQCCHTCACREIAGSDEDAWLPSHGLRCRHRRHWHERDIGWNSTTLPLVPHHTLDTSHNTCLSAALNTIN